LEELLRERQRLAFHVENSPLAAVEYDHEFRIRRWSAQAHRLFGWKAREVLGKHNFDFPFVHESDRGQVSSAIQRLIERREPRNVLRNRNYRKNGEILVCEWYNSVLLDEKGRVSSVFSLAQDISHQERSFMERTIAMVSERERQRIGQELHDVLAQQLTGLALLSKALEVKLRSRLPGGVRQAARLAQLASGTALQVRNISSGLYPAELEKQGLVAALRELAVGLSQLFRRPCRFQSSGSVPEIDQVTSLNIFRIAQEAANNALKHSRAAEVSIRLLVRAGRVELSVKDNGRGFNPSRVAGKGKGLRIMTYRAESIGANFAIVPAVPRGTLVTCTLHI
jgi:PAS domain S-box-containing protein